MNKLQTVFSKPTINKGFSELVQYIAFLNKCGFILSHKRDGSLRPISVRSDSKPTGLRPLKISWNK